jgi:DNA-binding NarL/FixJ family response regulator
VHLAAREWDASVEVSEGALSADFDVRWRARFVRLLATATVERTLDAMARREDVDVDAVGGALHRRIDEVRAAGPVEAMDLAVAAAAVTRLSGGDASAFAGAASLADSLGDAWLAATMRMHEADAAAAAGEAARAVDALRSAHEAATRLGAKPLLADIEALSRRARISVEAAEAPALEAGDVARLGLTPREAEVLALVSAGRTNREIGTELYVSEKTASVHVSNILRKLGVTTRVEAAAVAQRLGV